MLRPDTTLARIAMPAVAQPLLPAQGQGQGGPFAAVFRQAHAEVQRVIEQGWPGDALPAMRPEAWVHRAQASAPAVAGSAPPSLGAQQQEFLASIAPWARQAAQTLGVSADLVSAHAALESGWGQQPLRDAAGQNTHNLFGLKAQGGWQGARAEALTTEYEDGTALKKTEAFRSYPDYASAFGDYARLLQGSPRYRAALNTGADAQAFAQGLARGGYATDPGYAAKLVRLAEQIQSRD
ncbi:flagellar protein FlgJ [Acidovorax soli]|uniref:Flagellar protein FlgJ n=1 Tax=Acidovorax soli TaxID=592050 RepID=A0A7X0PIG8_9BURK|nr:flagellar assembly peptidoglycan hydrolase FlgJ [Acidovorax soli]MBB6562538.1 flagellar protein FlgJ [Acidovorax soli]